MKDNIFLTKLSKNELSTRSIRSFSRRYRRLTQCQKNAIAKYWLLMGIEFNENLFDFTSIFGRDAPMILEIGFGTGSSLVSMAEQFFEYNFLGIEVYIPGIGSCLDSAYKKNLTNLRIIYYDAVEVLKKMIIDNSLYKVQIFFPDSWRKTRHNKRRIVQIPFLELVKNKLQPGGILHIATDWLPYAEYTLKVMSLIKGYKNQSLTNDYVSRPIDRPITKFEQYGLSLGHNILDLIFQKIKE